MTFLRGCAVAVVAALLFASGSPAAPAETPKLRLVVPAYFYPSGAGLKAWDRLLSGKGLEVTSIILNPASGPGTFTDSNYAKLLERAKKSKATLIGYVTTSYGKRPLADVKADVDQWLKLYPSIQGIFFDEQASGLPPLGYYRELYRYVHREKKLSLVVSNPGTICDEDYLALPCADATCLFEGIWKPESLDFPAWASRYPANRAYALPYQVSTSKQMREIVLAAAKKKIGVIYVTDASGVNPWDRLPTYWEEEVAAVQEANSRP